MLSNVHILIWIGGKQGFEGNQDCPVLICNFMKFRSFRHEFLHNRGHKTTLLLKNYKIEGFKRYCSIKINTFPICCRHKRTVVVAHVYRHLNPWFIIMQEKWFRGHIWYLVVDVFHVSLTKLLHDPWVNKIET